MIKRILVALDPDGDTPIATQYAIEMAQKYNAEVTGLAVVDTSNIYPTGIVGEPGFTHHARHLWEELSEKTRKTAENLLSEFKTSVEDAGIKYSAIKKEGASFERIIDEMKYHDLLIVGRDSHFFYNEPKQDTKTLAQVVKHGVAPTLVITDQYRQISNILVAFDGSNPAARSLKNFVQLFPSVSDCTFNLITINNNKPGSESQKKSEEIIKNSENYLKSHEISNFSSEIIHGKKPSDKILAKQKELDADLIILGAHAVSAIKRLAFGSTTHDLITKTNTPLFLSP